MDNNQIKEAVMGTKNDEDQNGNNEEEFEPTLL